LPDGRVVELVSTSGTVGEPYSPTSPLGTETGVQATEHPFQAAENGEAVSYVGEPGISGGTGETGPGEGNQWLATRTSEGWKTDDITPTANEFGPYQAFSADLSTQIFEGGQQLQSLAPEVPAGCQSLYARTSDGGAYRALFTPSEAPAAGHISLCGKPLFAGASSDESQIIFQSQAALTGDAQEATEVPQGHGHSELGAESGEPCMFGCNLYDSSEGHLRLVNALEGKPVPNATFGGYPGERGFTNFSNAISNDGSRVFWTDTQPTGDFEHVYVLESGANTVQVSGAGPAEYWTATRTVTTPSTPKQASCGDSTPRPTRANASQPKAPASRE